MELASKDVLSVLREKDINRFYHANTVQTSCIFLQHGRLLSRGTIDERGRPQVDDRMSKGEDSRPKLTQPHSPLLKSRDNGRR